MEIEVSNLTLIDLISEKHARLRKTVERRWNEQSDIQFSHAEWHLLAKIEQRCLTISQAAVMIGISRQAMQKTVKKLENQGYITTAYREGNNRDKFLYLTNIGEKYCQQNNELKKEIEQDLEKYLGKNEFTKLKTLFQKEWLVE